ncbi:Caspase-2 [Mizuhopecten yessoensis]|uniref:Caspase-2 n=1 Tax=Mizuhopecten yessoensis TaxID=6573 RepID=A0A210QY20_MIZYE|nr:Caspase-2 [Mizuhopecten yessoensis]
MEKIHKDALRKARIRLVRDLDPNAELWDMLVTESIFTPIMMEYIQAERTRSDKVRRLLDDLVRRGPTAYSKFLRCLRESGHEDLANTVEDNEYTLRGLTVPFRVDNQIRQGPANVVRTAPPTVTGQHIRSNPVQMFSGEERVVQQNTVTQHQPSAEGETGPASMACSLVTPSGVSIPPTANHTSQLASQITTANHTSQLASQITTGSSPSQSGRYTATGSSSSQTGSYTATGSSASQQESSVGMSTGQCGDDDNDDADDDIVMETADAPAPETEIQTAYQRASTERPTYRMESTPRGYCLIINNRDYTQESLMDPRTGTDVNRDELRQVFQELGFHVDAKDNLTGQAMKDTLKNFAAYEGLTRVDSLIVAFLCHGNSEKMYGVDGVPLYLQQDVFKVFSPHECPVMKGKPKLFLINSCRGGNYTILLLIM